MCCHHLRAEEIDLSEQIIKVLNPILLVASVIKVSRDDHLTHL